MVEHNRVVLITGETATGKTSQVPPALANTGLFSSVTVTLPRRVAARSACQWVAEVVGSVVGGKVGYRTAEEHFRSPETEILFCTDGVELNRRYQGKPQKGRYAIVPDEIHEWNLYQETMIAWMRRELNDDPNLTLVCMSASMDSAGLSDYLGGAPIIEILGRKYDIEEHQTSERPAVVAARQAKLGDNVLVFVDGKSEIVAVTAENAAILNDDGIVILPFHGEQTPAEQQLVFQRYACPVIRVATNVAETSLTIPGVRVVVDTGLAKRSEVHNGVRGLYTQPISQAEIKQRKGRCGREGEKGDYYLCSDIPVSDRPLFPTPEILRVPLEQLVLGLAAVGVEAQDLGFFHQPEDSEILRSKSVLQALGVFDSRGEITPTGKAMSHLPIEAHLARMIIEAKQRGVLNAVLTIVSCLEVGGVRGRGKKLPDGRRLPPVWRRTTKDRTSDLIAEMVWFDKATRMSPAQMYANDIHVKHFTKAVELRARLAHALHAPLDRYTGGSNREIIRACIPGMVERVYHRVSPGSYRGSDGQIRRMERTSVINPAKAEWIIGIPFDLGSRDGNVTRMITAASKVERAWVEGILPQPKVQGRLELARALAEGRIIYPEQAANQEVVDWVELLYQEFPDQVTAPTVEVLTEIYASLLGPVTTLDDLFEMKLRLFRRHVAPQHLLSWRGSTRRPRLVSATA